MSISAMVAQQTRIERQEAPHAASVSFDRHAANAFQQYVHAALAFSMKVPAAWLRHSQRRDATLLFTPGLSGQHPQLTATERQQMWLRSRRQRRALPAIVTCCGTARMSSTL